MQHDKVCWRTSTHTNTRRHFGSSSVWFVACRSNGTDLEDGQEGAEGQAEGVPQVEEGKEGMLVQEVLEAGLRFFIISKKNSRENTASFPKSKIKTNQTTLQLLFRVLLLFVYFCFYRKFKSRENWVKRTFKSRENLSRDKPVMFCNAWRHKAPPDQDTTNRQTQTYIYIDVCLGLCFRHPWRWEALAVE